MSAHIQPGSVRRASWIASPPPSVAVEISSKHVAAVAVAAQGGGSGDCGLRRRGAAGRCGRAQLNASTSTTRRRWPRPSARARKLSARPRHIALVLPDTVAQVSLVRFEKVPQKVQDLDQLIRWQVRKAAPFRIEDAQLSWAPGTTLRRRRPRVRRHRRAPRRLSLYERACDAAGAYAGHRRSRELQPDEHVLATVAAAVGRATGCWCTSAPTTRRWRSFAAGSGLLP